MLDIAVLKTNIVLVDFTLTLYTKKINITMTPTLPASFTKTDLQNNFNHTLIIK